MQPNLSTNEIPLRARLAHVGALLVLFASVGTAAQNTPQIELRDQAGQTLTLIELLDSSSVTIDPLTGDIIAVPADSTVCTGGGDCDSTVTIESFTVNPASISQGGSFVAVFDERGAFECSRSGLPGTDWNGGFQDPDFDVINVTVTSAVAPGDYDLVLTCRNGTASPTALATATRTISITEPDATLPQECIDQGRLAPAAWQRELNPFPRATSTVVETWTELFGNDFPAGGGTDMRVRPDRYLALRFNTGTSEPSGRIGFSDLGGNITDVLTRPALVSMSACPGDFTPQQDTDCRKVRVGSVNPSFRWTRTPGTSFQCELPPNAEYYFNISYVSSATENEPDPNQLDWQCDDTVPTTACGHRLQTFTD